MSAKDDLRKWLLSRAVSHDDAVIGSKFVAAYVAECIRDDRAARTSPTRIESIFGSIDFADLFGGK